MEGSEHEELSDLEALLLDLVRQRGPQSSLCPSEVARAWQRACPAVGPGEAWRQWMEPTRQAGRELHRRGLVEFTQRGRPVDPDRARGPIRLRWTGRTEAPGEP